MSVDAGTFVSVVTVQDGGSRAIGVIAAPASIVPNRFRKPMLRCGLTDQSCELEPKG